MAAKTRSFVQAFEDWRGIDLRKSDINRPGNAAKVFKNLDVLENFSLMGRRGFHLAANPLYNMYGIHNYSYVNNQATTAGADDIKEELVCCAEGRLFTLKYAAIKIYCSLDPWGWSVLPKSDKSGLEFVLTKNGSTLLTVALGTGYESSPVTLQDLATLINATGLATATVQYTLVVNGAQAKTAAAPTLTVDSVSAEWEVYDDLWVIKGSTLPRTYIEVDIASSGTAIDLKLDTTVNFADNEVLGCGLFPAASLKLCNAFDDTTNPKQALFGWWKPILTTATPAQFTTTSALPFDTGLSGTLLAEKTSRPAQFEDERDCCYIVNNEAYQYDTTHNGATDAYGLWKYDGKALYLAGLPPLSIYSAVDKLSGAALFPGTYKYRRSIYYKDYRENEIEMFVDGETSLVMAANNDGRIRVNSVSIVTPTTDPPGTKFNARFAYVNGLQTAQIFTIDGGAANHNHTLYTGCWVYVTDTAGVVYRAQAAQVSLSSVSLQGLPGAITLADNTVISTILNRLWRTKLNGNTFYLAVEAPDDVAAASGITIIDDAVVDASLGEQLLLPTNIQFGIPSAKSIAVHQGTIVVGGGKNIPREIHWEDPETPEFSPRAINNLALPTSYGGDVESVKSDLDSALLVFNSESVFSVQGALPLGEAQLGRTSQGGRGASGPLGVTYAEDAAYAISQNGPLLIRNGIIEKQFGKEVSPAFLVPNSSAAIKLLAEWGASFYEPLKHRVHIAFPFASISVTYQSEASVGGISAAVYEDPAVITLNAAYPDSAAKWYIYDWLNNIWYEYVVPAQIFPSAGLETHKDKLYTATMYFDGSTGGAGYVHVQCQREAMFSSAEGFDEKQDFADQHTSYDWQLTPQWDTGNLPSVFKVWHELKLFSMQPNYFIAAFSVLVRTYRNLKQVVVDTTRTLTFSASTDIHQKCKLDSNKATTMLFDFSGTVFKNPPIITGYEYTVGDNVYTKEGVED